MPLESIKVNLEEKSYKIYLGLNCIKNTGTYLSQLKISKRILIITQNKVPKIYLSTLKNSLSKNKFKVFTVKLSSGEQYKNLTSLLKIINIAIKNKFERNDSFLALGGGVISDLTGFAASIYFRGINFICIPTTLLGMVDAAIGGKTAINIKEGKNLLGTFYQPKIILIDPNCLKTLPKKEFLTGLGEIIKYALLEKTVKSYFSKEGFFKYLKRNKNKILKLNKEALSKVIFYSAYVKSIIVSKDEKESDLRAILNLGHTFAHGIEQAYNYKKYTHGEAVSIGICLASKLAETYKLIKKDKVNKICNLIKYYSLPIKLNNLQKLNQIIKAMQHDKKIKDGKLRFILPYKEIGRVKIVSGIPINDVVKILQCNVSTN